MSELGSGPDAPVPPHLALRPRGDPPLPSQPPNYGEALHRALAWLVAAWRRLLLAVLVFFVLFWWFSLPCICPPACKMTACVPPAVRAASPGSRYDGGTAMFTDALGWLEYYHREATRAGSAANAVAGKESAGIVEHAGDLSGCVLEMEEGFARADMTEALELDALEARLYRARDEARYFEDSTWPWLGRLACLPCGFFPLTLPCPSHPIAIARREVEAVRKVFSSLRVVNFKVLEQHEHVQEKGLDGAQKNVCKLSKRLRRDKPNVAPGQQGMLQLDLGSAAFGVCELTSREQARAAQFREQQLWSFTFELYQEEGRLEAISSELDNVYAGFSWSHEHIRVGIKAINELLEMFGPY